MAGDAEHYKREFFQEAREILETVNNDILRAEAEPDNMELLNAIFRGVHTIKGSAGVFEMNEISEFAHHLEGLLDALRGGLLKVEPDIVDVVLAGADHLELMLNDFQKGKKPESDEDLVERFKALRGGVNEKPSEPETQSTITNNQSTIVNNQSTIVNNQSTITNPEIDEQLRQLGSEGLNAFRIEVNYTSEVFKNGFDPVVFLKNIRASSRFYRAVTEERPAPPIRDFEPLNLYLHPTIYIATELSLDEVRDLAFDPDLVQVDALTPEASDQSGLEGHIPSIDKEDLDEFVLGSTEIISSMEKAIIDYERTHSPEALNSIFRGAHTIKGDSAYIGLTNVTTFAHAFEALLERLRNGSLKRTPEIVDLILKAVDAMKNSISEISRGKFGTDFSRLQARLENAGSEDGGKEDASAAGTHGGDPLPTLSEETREVFMEQVRQNRKVLASHLKDLPLDASAVKIVMRSLNGLKKASEFVGAATLTALVDSAVSDLEKSDHKILAEDVDEIISFLEGLEQDRKKIGEILVEQGKIAAKDVGEALAEQKSLGEILVDRGKISRDDVDKALKKQEAMDVAQQLTPVAAEPEIRTMRVDEGKIEDFSNMIGELLVARNTYEYLLNKLDDNDNGQGELKKLFKDNLHLFSRLTDDLRHGILAVRMIPIKGTFQKFSRVVRDISRKQKKSIDFITEGEETEIDKKVADILSDPLIHIVRNACDHGIETPQERIAAGKPEKGTILFRAFQEGGNLVIKIIDDGRGIDRQALFEKARSMGLDFTSPDDDALLDLIFQPGFSTKKVVSDISGRGVGMDVVRTCLDSLKGDIRVSTEQGNGTEITLTISMSMGISDVLLVECGGRTYAVPFESVLETIKISPNAFVHNRDSLIFHYRGQVIPAQSLERLLGEDGSAFTPEKVESNGQVPLVILKNGGMMCGIAVDRFVRNMEMAIKPLPPALSDIDLFSGVSILGDGKLVLVLNPDRLV